MREFLSKNKWFIITLIMFILPEMAFAASTTTTTGGTLSATELKGAVGKFFYSNFSGTTVTDSNNTRQVYIILAQIVIGIIGAFKILIMIFKEDGKIEWSKMAIPGVMVILALPVGLKLLVNNVIFGLIDVFL